ncbi:acyltransferase [Vibrio owensii]|uniref:acyltransferase n=1 Tax=Vibrio owensii TaxID=696485 RepID=UPI0038CD3DF5
MGRRLKYLQFFLVMKLTSLLPDWQFIMRIRGFLVRNCFASVGYNFQINSTAMVINSSEVTIGDNVYLAHGVWIQGIGGVTLCDEVMLGPQTIISTNNHTFRNESFRFGSGDKHPVIIGKGSWTGAGTKILAGVTIGKGVVCAAGSVVVRDVPDWAKVAGVPAKVIGSSK